MNAGNKPKDPVSTKAEALFDENFLRHVRQFTLISLTILNLENTQCSISASGIQVLVVITDANTIDHLRMCLDLEHFILLEGVHHHLDAARLVSLIDTSEECSSTVIHLDLI